MNQAVGAASARPSRQIPNVDWEHGVPPATPLIVLVGMPSQLRPVFGDANLIRLGAAHPRVRVEQDDDAERFAARAADADGVIVWPAFGLPPAALRAGGRLRWVQSVSAGVDG